MRPRDTDRLKVYKAGWNTQDNVPEAAALMGTTLKVQNIVTSIWEATGAHSACPTVKIDRRRKNRSTSHGGHITLAPRMANLHVITHELAHELLRGELPATWSLAASHGIEFRAAWVEVIHALGSINRGEYFQVAHRMSIELKAQFRAAGLEWSCEETRDNLMRRRFAATGGGTLPEAPTVEPEAPEAPEVHTAKAELDRRAANRKAKRDGGAKLPFPSTADPSLFKASATELRAMA